MAKIEHIDLSLRVYDSIKAMILSGKLVPGQKIVQMKLAEEIGVSRTPLLKALQMLEHELLVESIPRRGMLVKAMKPQDLIDAFECREALEGVAARLTATKITDRQILKMKGLFLPFEDCPDDISLKAYIQADQQFHKYLIQYSQNQVLNRIEMLGNIHIISYNQGLIRPPQETLPEHFALIEAIERRDGEMAEKHARAHLRKSRDRIAESLVRESVSSG